MLKKQKQQKPKSHFKKIETSGDWEKVVFQCGDREVIIETDKKFKKLYCPFCKQEVIE